VAAIRSTAYRQLPPHAHVRETETEYVIELDVADFTDTELAVDAVGPVITVRGDQVEDAGSDVPFRIHERLEERFRLPDDADAEGIAVEYRHGVLRFHVARTPLRTRRLPIRRPPAAGFHADAEAV